MYNNNEKFNVNACYRCDISLMLILKFGTRYKYLQLQFIRNFVY